MIFFFLFMIRIFHGMGDRNGRYTKDGSFSLPSGIEPEPKQVSAKDGKVILVCPELSKLTLLQSKDTPRPLSPQISHFAQAWTVLSGRTTNISHDSNVVVTLSMLSSPSACLILPQILGMVTPGGNNGISLG